MSGAKCGEVTLTPAEIARRAEALRLRVLEQQAAEQRARISAARLRLRTLQSDIETVEQELKGYGAQWSRSATTRDPSLIVDSDLLEALSVAERERTRLGEVRSRRRRALLDEIEAHNAALRRLVDEIESFKAQEVAAGVAHSLRAEPPRALPTVVSLDTVRLLRDAADELQAAKAELARGRNLLAEAATAAAVQPLRDSLRAATQSDAPTAPPPSAVRVYAVPVDLTEGMARWSEWSAVNLLRAVVDDAAGAATETDSGIAISAAREMLNGFAAADARVSDLSARLDAAIVDVLRDAHEADLDGIERKFSDVRARIVGVRQAPSLTAAQLALRSLITEWEPLLTTCLSEAEGARDVAEADRQANAFVDSLAAIGFLPVLDPASVVRVPRGGQLGPVGSATVDERHIVRRFAFRGDAARQIALLQSLDEPGRITTLSGEVPTGASLASLVREAATSTDPDPAWVDEVCGTALPDAAARLQENGYALRYQPWSGSSAAASSAGSTGSSTETIDKRSDRNSREN